MLSEGVVGLHFLVQHAVDPFADAVQQTEGLLDRPAEGLNVRYKGRGAVLVVLCAGNGIEGAPVCIAVQDFVWHLNEEAALGGALGVDGYGGADVASRLDIFARLRGDGHVYGGMRRGPRLRAGEEVLDQGAEAVELGRGGVPAEEDFAGRGFECQGQHVLLVFHVHLDLVLLFGVGDGEARSDFDLGAIFRAGADEGADDTCGLGGFTGVSSDSMVEDGKNGLLSEREKDMSVDRLGPDCGFNNSDAIGLLGILLL